MSPIMWDVIRAIVFFGGGLVVSRWLIMRPPDELAFDPNNPPAGFVRNDAMPQAGRKLVAFWLWLCLVNAAGCTIGSENARRDLATMPTAMALREIRQERERLRDRYGDAFIEAEMDHWREQR